MVWVFVGPVDAQNDQLCQFLANFHDFLCIYASGDCFFMILFFKMMFFGSIFNLRTRRKCFGHGMGVCRASSI